jgi:hypothetical protein
MNRVEEILKYFVGEDILNLKDPLQLFGDEDGGGYFFLVKELEFLDEFAVEAVVLFPHSLSLALGGSAVGIDREEALLP